MRILLIAIPGLIAASINIWINIDNGALILNASIVQKEELLSIMVAFLLVSSLAAVMTYLQTGFKISIEEEIENELSRQGVKNSNESAIQKQFYEFNSLKNELEEIRVKLSKTNNLSTAVGQTSKDALVKELKELIVIECTSEIRDAIKDKILKELEKDSNHLELFQLFEESRRRLNNELVALGWRGNLNLALGAVTTVIGLILLGNSVFSELTEVKDLWSFSSHFLPRLTLVILIELFAYFFLSLYKNSLTEIKYFQNELTNVESKQISLQAAISFSNETAINNIIFKVAETERNHVLTKDQTTVELEKAKIEKASQADLTKLISEMLHKKS